MNRCEHDLHLGLLVDGLLDAESAGPIEAHLARCPVCAAEVRAAREARVEVRRLAAGIDGGGGFDGGAGLHWPAGVRARAHRRVEWLLDEQRQQGLLRIARVLSGAAACVLVAGSIWLSSAGDTGRDQHSRRREAGTVPPAPMPVAPAAAWERTALALPAAAGPDNGEDWATPEWVVADLSAHPAEPSE